MKTQTHMKARTIVAALISGTAMWLLLWWVGSRVLSWLGL